MPNCAGVPPTDEEIAAAIKTNAEQRARVAALSVPVYAAFFLGQLSFDALAGYPFSAAFAAIADKVRAQGVTVAVFNYTDYASAETWLKECAEDGGRIAAVGYSRGVEAATLIQTLMPVDLLISIAASTLVSDNRPVALAKDSTLYAGTDFLSSACQRGYGYRNVVHVTAGFGIPVWSHLNIPASPIVINGVLDELAKLKGN